MDARTGSYFIIVHLNTEHVYNQDKIAERYEDKC